MDRKSMGFVDVDALMRQVTVERAVAYYGVTLPEVRRIGSEIRMRCFLNCGRDGETGERALAIQAEHPARIWRCFHAGCGRGGNLVSLCDYLKPGEHGNGKPRGERFKAILADLRAMAAGESPPEEREAAAGAAVGAKPERRAGNVPLGESPNERARGLTTLDEKFVVDPERMTAKAASYFRARRFLTPDACRRWRMGYLPRDSGGDRAGGTMRGLIVYPMLAEDGQVLTWFGRDAEYEGKVHEWIAGGKQGNEPAKFHFVKGFQRGLELFGQHRFAEAGVAERLKGIGLPLVEGPNDVIALDALGVPAVGLCAATITSEQAEKAAALAQNVGGGVVTLMLDCDEEGEAGAKETLVALAQRCPVRLAWSTAMHGGAFRGRQPESLTTEEWGRLRGLLAWDDGG